MTSAADPYRRHPELSVLIRDPLNSFCRTFKAREFIAARPELDGGWLHPDAHLAATRARALTDHSHGDLWDFAYGSLMWEPALVFSEVRRAHASRHSRAFILKDVHDGCDMHEAPGLMAAFDTGAGCDGLVFCIAEKDIAHETEVLWRREMIGPSYMAAFVEVATDGAPIRALSFIADHDAQLINTNLTRDEQIRFLTSGAGFMGTSLEYSTDNAAHFTALGISDDTVPSLLRETIDYLAAH